MASNLAPSKITLIMLASLVVFAKPAVATYDSAVAAFDAGAYNEALGEFERLARNGDDRARYYLGLMHKDGYGVASDPVGALVWFLCAATDNSEFAAQNSNWREQLTAHMKPSVVAAAEQKARLCRSGAVGGRVAGVAIWSPRGERRPDEDASVPKASATQQWSGATRATRATPQRALWFRIFYFPAHASINGLEFLAERTDFHALKRDLRLVTSTRNNAVIGFFALLWWILILRTVLRFCRSVRGTDLQLPPGELGPGGAGGWRRQGTAIMHRLEL